MSEFLSDLGQRQSSASSDEHEISFLFQRISVALFHINSVQLHKSFAFVDHSDE